MNFDKPDDPHSRGTALARLLAEALKSQSKPTEDAQTSACPDAEVLAAYADHGLAEEEGVRWESHFADCNRCQKVIAVLAASGAELTEAEVERLGSLAAASSSGGERVAREATTPWTMIWRRPVFLRWLVPAVGVASAAALWFALRQVPPYEALNSQKIAATAGAPQNEIAPAANTSSARADETQVAEANQPPPPAAAPSSGAVLRDKEKAPANSPADTKQQTSKKREAFRSSAQEPGSETERASESREEAAKDNRIASAQAGEPKSQLDQLAAAALGAPASAPSTPPSAGDGERAIVGGFEGVAGAPAATQLKAALARNASPPIVFSSADRRALWRLGSGGRIEHSADQGQSWQPEASGVTADLLAGAAPSEKIAWAVGRAGVIVRTEDGEHWQRVAPPPTLQTVAPSAVSTDWIAVEARDGLHATITSRDLRRFVTEDGGRTWAAEQ